MTKNAIAGPIQGMINDQVILIGDTPAQIREVAYQMLEGAENSSPAQAKLYKDQAQTLFAFAQEEEVKVRMN